MTLTTGEIIEIAGIGPVLFVRSTRARRMNVSIRPAAGVRVAIPRGDSLDDALRFVRLRTEWIKEQLLDLSLARERHREIFDSAGKLDRAEADLLLTTRIRELSSLFELPFNRLYLKEYKSRWGSCSVKSDIGLNIKLTKLPVELADYIMLHELTHTRWRGHGPRFWAMMERMMPGARALDSRMKDYLLEFL